MRFIYTFVSLLAVACAQDKPNSFNIPTSGTYTGLKAGGSQTFTWSNPSSGTVTINLKSGANTDLKTIKTLASSIPNSGSYTWNIPSDFVEGANYALEIVSDSDKSVVNYTPQFVVSSDVKAVATSNGPTSLITASTAGTAAAATSASSTSASAATMTSSVASAVAMGTGASTRAGNGTAVSTGSPSNPSGSARASGTSATGAVPSTGAGASVQVAGGLLAAALFMAL